MVLLECEAGHVDDTRSHITKRWRRSRRSRLPEVDVDWRRPGERSCSAPGMDDGGGPRLAQYRVDQKHCRVDAARFYNGGASQQETPTETGRASALVSRGVKCRSLLVRHVIDLAY